MLSLRFLLATCFALLAFSTKLVVATDTRREVYTFDPFCAVFKKECKTIATYFGKPEPYCQPGYDGNGTATVNCIATYGHNNSKYIVLNDQVVKAIKGKYVA
ncbi:hypothetical protein T439DRAFT_350794 [Meredithblackwellia eburnea MCA 4105]